MSYLRCLNSIKHVLNRVCIRELKWDGTREECIDFDLTIVKDKTVGQLGEFDFTLKWTLYVFCYLMKFLKFVTSFSFIFRTINQ